jgi:hypothetical protein
MVEMYLLSQVSMKLLKQLLLDVLILRLTMPIQLLHSIVRTSMISLVLVMILLKLNVNQEEIAEFSKSQITHVVLVKLIQVLYHLLTQM